MVHMLAGFEVSFPVLAAIPAFDVHPSALSDISIAAMSGLPSACPQVRSVNVLLPLKTVFAVRGLKAEGGLRFHVFSLMLHTGSRSRVKELNLDALVCFRALG